jgi:hypothetical protein
MSTFGLSMTPTGVGVADLETSGGDWFRYSDKRVGVPKTRISRWVLNQNAQSRALRRIAQFSLAP